MLAEAAEVPIERLPPVLGAHEPCGAVSSAMAPRSAVPRRLPVAVGGPDGSVGALGSGAAVGRADGGRRREHGRPASHLSTARFSIPSGRSILNAYLLPRAVERRRPDRDDGRGGRVARRRARVRLARGGVLRARVVGRPGSRRARTGSCSTRR